MTPQKVAVCLSQYLNKRQLYIELGQSFTTAINLGGVEIQLDSGLRRELRKQLFVELHNEAEVFDELAHPHGAEEERAMLEQMLVKGDDK